MEPLVNDRLCKTHLFVFYDTMQKKVTYLVKEIQHFAYFSQYYIQFLHQENVYVFGQRDTY
jgi:hypothetical protein